MCIRTFLLVLLGLDGILYELCTLRLLRICVVSQKKKKKPPVDRMSYFSIARKWPYIYACTLERSDILKIKSVLVQSVLRHGVQHVQ